MQIIYRLDRFIANHSIVNMCQYGFKKKSSTVNALHDLTEKNISCHDEKKICMSIFIDLRKAFDTVDYDILVEKLEFTVYVG